MESLSDLAAGKASKEFVRILEERLKAVEARERDVERREKNLRALKDDIDAKLRELTEARRKLLAMTGEVDRSRQKDLSKAVLRFSAMKPAMAAEILVQMELASVAAILTKMEAEPAGSILDAMVQSVTKLSGDDTDADQTRDKLKELGRIGEELLRPKS